MIRVANVRTLTLAEDETAVYVGRGCAPLYKGKQIETANLGNPFVVGRGWKQGEAASAYLDYLRSKCREKGVEYDKIIELANRVRQGEKLVLVCWCTPRPCHAQHIKAAIEGYVKLLSK